MSKGQGRRVRAVIQALSERGDDEAHGMMWGKGRGKGKYAQPIDLEAVFKVLGGEQVEQRPEAAFQNAAAMNRYHDQRRQQAEKRRRLAREAKATSLSPPHIPSVAGPSILAGRDLTSHLYTKLLPASPTGEKYALFRRYQMAIHRESEDEVSDRKGFERFLCKSSLRTTPVQGKTRGGSMMKDAKGEPVAYGAYHMEWRLRSSGSSSGQTNGDAHGPAPIDELVAVGVLDILPSALSSVYLFYSPSHANLQLGHLSALREIVLARQLHASGLLKEPRYYMGFYIEDCAKMRYKAGFRPSEVLDVDAGGEGKARTEWREVNEVVERIREGQAYGWRVASPSAEEKPNDGKGQAAEQPKAGYGELANSSSDDGVDDSDEDEDDFLPCPSPPGILDPATITPAQMARTAVLEASAQEEGVKPLMIAGLGDTERRQVIECVAALGLELAQRVVFFT